MTRWSTTQELGAAPEKVGVERSLGRPTEQVPRGAAVAGHHRRLDDAEQAEIDGVGSRGDLEAGGIRQPGVLLSPVAQERVPAGDPENRGDADVLEAGRQRQRRVQAGADPVAEDVARSAHLLAVAPARRWGGVVDPQVVNRLKHRLDDGVDPLARDVLRLQRAGARRFLEQGGSLGDDGADRGVVRLDEGREQLEGQHRCRGVEGPLPRREDPDRRVGDDLVAGRSRSGPERHRDGDLGGRLLLEVGHVLRVEADGGVVDDEGDVTARAVDMALPRAGDDHAVRVTDLGPDDEIFHRPARGGEPEHDAVEEGQATVRHRVVDDRRREDLDLRPPGHDRSLGDWWERSVASERPAWRAGWGLGSASRYVPGPLATARGNTRGHRGAHRAPKGRLPTELTTELAGGPRPVSGSSKASRPRCRPEPA